MILKNKWLGLISGNIILVLSVILFLSYSCKHQSESSNASPEESIPESYINRDKKIGLPNEPDESAALPFCQDSTEIPKYKKRICALKILSTHLIESNPQWKSTVGVVYLRLTIDSDSTLSEVKLSEDFSGQKIGDEVALKCYEFLRNYKCIPAKKKGLRIKSKLVIPIYFGLQLLDKNVVQ
jgi:hypothetical protein